MPNPQSRIARQRRQERVRRRVRGTDGRPRLSIFRSGKHMYAQVITDASGRTLLAVSTLTPELRTQLPKTTTVAAAKEVGKLVARRCQEKGITSVIFDRNGFLYHGRVRAVADGAREAGLQF
ncbi:MAG TPA: 50S ribosomal protein L18 [Candidatus Eisenbacteria bacterium]|nr:50S ribosomal protein L18 [Candidatus Eisenbacteria bacterium]